MKLHLFGASGTGVSTPGGALAAALGMPHLDTDDYFWQTSGPPFTGRQPPAVRGARLAHGLAQAPGWVLGGSLVGWDEKWLTAFDLVVFLWLPPALRLREHACFGQRPSTLLRP